jgi:hypothetical protein
MREEQNNDSLNSSFESHSPPIEFIPNKIDLGKKKFSFRKKGSIKNPNSPKIFNEMNLKESKSKEVEDTKIKSTKLGNKNINKVIDKIVSIKLPTDMEDDDNIMKSVIKLRKYCYKLIKKRKKLKKQKPIISLKKSRPDRGKIIKRRTLIYSNSLLKHNNYLFGQKETNHEATLTREDTYEQKPSTFLNSKLTLFEKERHLTKNESSNSHERKTYKLNSLKDLKPIREISNEKANIDKKKLRRVQTLNMREKSTTATNKTSQKKEKEIKKNENNNAQKQITTVIKGPVTSTKLARPSKFVIINNNINTNINNPNIIFRKDAIKKNSLFGVPRYDFKRLKTIKEKDKIGGRRNSLRKNGKHTIKLFSSIISEV